MQTNGWFQSLTGVSIIGTLKCQLLEHQLLQMAPKKNYSKEQMNAALEAVGRGIPVATAAKMHSVPRVTLMYKSSGRLPVECRMGPSTVLTPKEEDLLEKWILSLAKVHHPVTKEQLLDSVYLIIQESKRPNPFANSRPGRKWYDSFMKRHPNISERVAQNLTPARENVCELQLRQWFREIEEYLKSKNLFEITTDPRRVFNSDESAFFLQPKGDKVLAKKGDKSVYNAGTNDEKENLTVLVTASAAGEFAPPMIIFKYERIPSHIALSVNKSWGIGRSESGWMCGSTFYEYVTNVFVPWLDKQKIERPILLFIDGHVSHMTLHLSQFCSNNGIELFALYPNSTHLIQPMDVAVFKPLKQFWRKSVRDWHLKNHGKKLRKENFGNIFENALSNITKETIQNGFKRCGLCPFNVENVKFSNIAISSENTKQEMYIKESLAVLEKFITSEKLNNFRRNFNADWSGNIEDTSLFNVWATMKKRTMIGIEEEVNIVRQITSEITTNQVDEIADQSNNPRISENQNSNSRDMEYFHDSSEPGSSRLNSGQMNSKVNFADSQVTPLKEISLNLVNNISPLNLSSLKQQVPTPFKKALFWPEEIGSNKKRKREKIPSAITSEVWQEYHKKKEMEKKNKLEAKERKAEERKRKKEDKLMKTQKSTKRKKKVSNSESSLDSEEWVESGDSMDDVDIYPERDSGSEEQDDVPLSYLATKSKPDLNHDEIRVGDFVLARFLGGKKQSLFYRYVCVIQNIYKTSDIEVASFKSINDKCSFRLLEKDISTIKFEDIVDKLQQPEIHNTGDRIKYVFSNEIDILEA